jgi:hypothetical protein
MFQHNFWYWLLRGLFDLAMVIAAHFPVHTVLDLPQFTYNFLAGALAPIIIFVGSFFNLCWFALFLGLLIASETARAFFAGYRTLAKMLPLP